MGPKVESPQCLDRCLQGQLPPASVSLTPSTSTSSSLLLGSGRGGVHMSVGAEGGNTSREEHKNFALTDRKQNRECLEDA